MLKVVDDILLALDSGNLALLSLLDLSAVFDTVDHDMLLRRLQTSYGLDGVVIKWFASYMSGRAQHVRTPTTTSLPSPVAYGVPHGSVLGPILFLLYVVDLLKLIKRHRLSPHAYADDTQIYGFCQPSDVNGVVDRMSACFDEVSSGMRANRLQVNPSKTEVLWCALVDDSIRSRLRQYVPAVLNVLLLCLCSRPQSANTRHCHRQIVLCSTTSDSERQVLSSTTRPADTNSCFGCQQGPLLLLRAGRCLRSSTAQAAVHPQRCRPTRVLSQALRSHHPLLRYLHWLRVTLVIIIIIRVLIVAKFHIWCLTDVGKSCFGEWFCFLESRQP